MKLLKIFITALITLFNFNLASHGSESENESLYLFKADLIDQDNQKNSFNVYEGNPVLVTLFYASCNYSCPVMIEAIKKMEAKLPLKAQKKLRVLLVSIDPQNDTPEALKKVTIQHKIDTSRWKLAQTSEDKVREIAALLGVIYRKSPDGSFNHNTIMTLLDEKGSPIFKGEGLESLNSLAEKLLK